MTADFESLPLLFFPTILLYHSPYYNVPTLDSLLATLLGSRRTLFFTGVSCGKLVPMEEAKTDSNGKAVHGDCVLPKHVVRSPLDLPCPRCEAEPGAVCEVLLGEGLEIVHVERIKAAMVRDVSAMNRPAGTRTSSKSSE
jgi:hypothetical protein